MEDNIMLSYLNDVLDKGNSAGNKNISDLATPTSPNDAATKAYVDSLEIAINQIYNILAAVGYYGAQDIDGNTYKTVGIGKHQATLGITMIIQINLNTVPYITGMQ